MQMRLCAHASVKMLMDAMEECMNGTKGNKASRIKHTNVTNAIMK